MSNYRFADDQSQWFADDWPGDKLELTADTAVTVLHTTESTSWPDYDGGAKAPHYTVLPDLVNRRLKWRAHFPDEMSSRALRNEAGGVETNTLNCVQVEMIGTCDPAHRERWGTKVAGKDYLFWPEAPTWALLGIARFLVDQNQRHGLALKSLRFKPYPASFGTDNGVRMTFAQWRNFVGVCGHQHVPENTHGDPGDIDIIKILAFANEFIVPTLRVVTANLKQKNPLIDKALVELRKLNADVIFIQEAAGYHKKIREALPHHQVLATDHGSHGRREVVIAVRKQIDVLEHGDFQATKNLSETGAGIAQDRHVQWALLRWQGRRLVAIDWHGNAVVQDKDGNPLVKAPRVTEYVKQIKKLETFIAAQQKGGFGALVGADTNYVKKPWLAKFVPWFFSPDRMYRRQGLTTVSRRFDKIAYPKGFDMAEKRTLRAPGCDHDWLIVDLEKA